MAEIIEELQLKQIGNEKRRCGDRTARADCSASSKGRGRDREIPLSPTLLIALREYYRWMRPRTYLFPGTRHSWRADPLTTKVI